MLQENLKKMLPHVIAVVTFIVITCIYFHPQLEGLQLRQGDTEQAIGMSKETSDFRAKFGTEPLWTNSAFSGMPTYQISTVHSNYVPAVSDNLLLKIFDRPIGYILLAMIAFYILLLCYGVGPWIGMIGAVAFGLASFFMLYLGAGHNSKVQAIALLPGVFGGLLLAYRKDYIMGSILFSFFLCLQVGANHLQMTYYSLFLIAAIILVEAYIYLKDKLYLKFLKVSSVVLVAAVLAILPSLSNLYTTYEYGKYSTRGKSELTITPPSAATQGRSTSEEALDASYITEHNFGYGEVWTIAIPDVKGGKQEYIGSRKDANDILKNVNPQFRDYIAQSSSYWGEQSFAGGAYYYGVTLFILFILGLVFIRDPIKWAFLAASVLAVMLSWKYGGMVEFFINHFPWFNKFRDSKMMLLIVHISLPFVAMLFVKEMFSRMLDKKKLLYTILIVNGVFLLFYIMPHTFFDFVSLSESNNFGKQISASANNPAYQEQFNAFVADLEGARTVIFRKDVLRSLFFSLLVSGLVYLFVIGKVKKNVFLGTLGAAILLDLWLVDTRLLNNDESGNGYKSWVHKQEYGNPYRASVADNFILSNELNQNPALRSKIDAAVTDGLTKVKASDTEVAKENLTFRELNFNTDYRVLFAPNAFSNGEISYFHKSLGGYNGAKLKKYQELIDFYITPENGSIVNALRDTTFTMEKMNEILKNKVPVLNMLNTKYIIYNPGAAPLVNNHTFGNCWFVKDIQFVDNADNEMLALGKTDLKTTAVVNQKYKGDVQSFQFDSTASIKLQSCISNHLVYTSKSATPQVAVFSEIYYPKGWDAFIDGKKVPYFSANYLLRALSVPAGEHTIEFKFEPRSYSIGEKVSIASSILLILLLVGSLGLALLRKVKAQ